MTDLVGKVFGMLWFAVTMFLFMLKQTYEVAGLFVSLLHSHSMTLSEAGVL